MSDYESEEEQEGPVEVLYPCGPTTWKTNRYDIVAIAATTAGGLFSVLGQGLNLLYREFSATAEWVREDHDRRAAMAEWEADQSAAAEDLRRLIEGPDVEVEGS